jgi:hypothetical protein
LAQHLAMDLLRAPPLNAILRAPDPRRSGMKMTGDEYVHPVRFPVDIGRR